MKIPVNCIKIYSITRKNGQNGNKIYVIKIKNNLTKNLELIKEFNQKVSILKRKVIPLYKSLLSLKNIEIIYSNNNKNWIKHLTQNNTSLKSHLITRKCGKNIDKKPNKDHLLLRVKLIKKINLWRLIMSNIRMITVKTK